jgi:hypothetical protein
VPPKPLAREERSTARIDLRWLFDDRCDASTRRVDGSQREVSLFSASSILLLFNQGCWNSLAISISGDSTKGSVSKHRILVSEGNVMTGIATALHDPKDGDISSVEYQYVRADFLARHANSNNLDIAAGVGTCPHRSNIHSLARS